MICRESGARHLYEVHDLWPLSLIELGGMSRCHPFIQLIQWAEGFSYRHADTVVSMLPCAKGYMTQRGMAPEKFVFIPNGVDVNEWDEAEEIPQQHSALIERLRNEGRFVVAYAGAHGIANALHTVVEAGALSEKESVAFILVGQGSEKESLIREAERRQVGNVFFLPSVRKKAVPALLRKMDALFIGLQDQSLFRFGISPNKLIDYMMSAKPIVQAIRAGNDIVTESGCGISIEPENPQALADAVRVLMNLPSQELERMGKRGNAYVRQYHDYEILAERFLKACEPRRGGMIANQSRIPERRFAERVAV
jgi:glycosyltransferase involved in cell wall biosynthesis